MEYRGTLEAGGRRFVVVVSRFNELVTERLLKGARACLLQHGVGEQELDVVWVPGAWELPAAVHRIARAGRHAAVVALGCVVRGETPHFDFVAGEATKGLAAASLATGVPVALGVLTTETTEQALARAGGKGGNKGWDAALSALEMADLFRQLDGDRAGT